jgi:hypothetical protein
MSNFLRRLAATVTQSQARLQPMLGSIFEPAALPLTDYFPTQGESSSQTFASHRQETATPYFDTPASSLISSNRSPAADQLLLPAQIAADPHLRPITFSSPRDTRVPAHGSPSIEDPVSPSKSSKSEAANQLASLGPYHPLITASQQPAPKVQPLESLPIPAALRTSASEAAGRSQPAHREPDEIYIHIGRIEVAAIAKPAPRPAAAPAQKSLNLDDYLRRGNGRSG